MRNDITPCRQVTLAGRFLSLLVDKVANESRSVHILRSEASLKAAVAALEGGSKDGKTKSCRCPREFTRRGFRS